VLDVVVMLPLAIFSSISDPAGSANRAVGRGPEAEGPLGFFRMGCGILTEDIVDLLSGFDAGVTERACTVIGLEADDSGEGYQSIVS
jgi:hypothetical protein